MQFGTLKGMHPQAIILALWVTVALANGALCFVGPFETSELLKTSTTSFCGLLISLSLSFVTRNMIERNSRFVWPVLAILALLGGSTLWLIDVTLQVQWFGRGGFHWATPANLIEQRFNVVYYNLLFALQTAALALLAISGVSRARERQLAPELREALVPNLLLQPLVENAIKYAVAPAKEPVKIVIEASGTETELVLVVEDDGHTLPAGAHQKSTGLGLKNVGERLKTLYGERAQLEAVQRERGFLVVIRMPLQRAGVSQGVQ